LDFTTASMLVHLTFDVVAERARRGLVPTPRL
jgi:hypothetical protein